MGQEMFTFFGAGDKIQGPVHAKLGLYHGECVPDSEPFF